MKRIGPWAAAVIASTLCVAAPPPLTPFEQVGDQFARLRKHLSAVSSRFKGGMKVASPSQEGDRRPTPALQCCEANLRAAGERLIGVDKAVLQLAACYEKQGNEPGRNQVQVVRSGEQSLSTGLREFAKATNRNDARGALAGVTRAFLQLDKELKKLEDCSETSGP